MTISATTRGLRPGVCTSSNRPSSPFEGQTIYETDTDLVKSYDGSNWVTIGPTAVFNSSATVTATDASWVVPTLKNPIVRVTVIGGGGSGQGGGSAGPVSGNAGGSSTFGVGESFEIVAVGGAGGKESDVAANGTAGHTGMASANQGHGGVRTSSPAFFGVEGQGGEIKIAYCDLTGKTTLNLVVGAGGAAAGSSTLSGAGGRGEIIVEYAS